MSTGDDFESLLPEAPPVDGVSSLSLRVRDPALSARWYRGVLGVVPIVGVEEEGAEGGAVVVVQPTSALVLVFQPGGPDRVEDDQPAAPLAQIALKVESAELVDAWAEHFDKLGLTHSGVVEAPPGRMVALPDPDGVLLTIVAATG